MARSHKYGARMRAKAERLQKRQLRDEDILGFYEAADARKPMMTRDEVIAHLKRKNSHRMWRIGYDYRWMQKELKKLGMNPDDARELL